MTRNTGLIIDRTKIIALANNKINNNKTLLYKSTSKMNVNFKITTLFVLLLLLQLDDAALQLYKDGDYGSYLDLEASISEQQEEFEGFQSK